MSVPLEHDYVGLAELPSMESSDKFSQRNSGLNLKATELRLGLPGSESPDRDGGGVGEGNNVYPIGMLKIMVSGAKRGFSDTINGGSGKWVLSGNGGSEVGLGKDGGLFSPRGVSAGKALAGPESGNPQTGLGASVVKDSIPQSPKPSHEKKPQISALSAKAQVVGWPPIRSFRKNSMTTHPQKNEDDTEAKCGCLYVKVSMDGAPYLRKVDLKNFASYQQLSSALEKMFSCFTISEFLSLFLLPSYLVYSVVAYACMFLLQIVMMVLSSMTSSGQCGSHGVSSHDNLSQSRLMDLLHGSEYVLTYEDKDGDWMLVGDVPWEMFTDSCKRLRIMKSSEAIGLAPRAMEKCRSRN